MSDTAIRQYQNMPPTLQKKTDKQFSYLLEDIRHPSLHVKKYHGVKDVWQGRIDRNWRFYFFIVEPEYIVVSIIAHPK